MSPRYGRPDPRNPNNHRRLLDGGDDPELAATLRAVFEGDAADGVLFTRPSDWMHQQPVCESVKPGPGGSVSLMLTPVQVLCLACIDWADHLRKNGFDVSIKETAEANMPRLKHWLNVPSSLEWVHTAKVAGYFIEGHMPADDNKRLLKEKPRARGLALPGLPRASPGREVSNPLCETACTILDNASRERDIRREAYNTLLVGPDGKTSVFARHCSRPAGTARQGRAAGRPGKTMEPAFGDLFRRGKVGACKSALSKLVRFDAYRE